MITSEKQPCDEAAIQAGAISAYYTEQAKPWVPAAAILAATEVPSGVSSGIQQQINRFIDRSFITGFRVVIYISAGLAGSAKFCGSWLIIDEEEIQ